MVAASRAGQQTEEFHLVQEFEKLISFSGTPTVVWRRTCEICVVGAEFSMLTQWNRNDLLGKYIYQVSLRASNHPLKLPLTSPLNSSSTPTRRWSTGKNSPCTPSRTPRNPS
jgi:hypothetical protein